MTTITLIIYKSAIINSGLEPRRADDIYRPSTIIQDIWDYTKNAKLIIADLTSKNPNVFYELGLAHALAKPAILITNSMDDIPFDLKALRIIEYNKNESNWGEILQGKIEKAIEETLNSPLNSVLPAFLKIDRSKKKEIIISESDFLGLRRDMDLMRNELRHYSYKPIRTVSPEMAEKLNLDLINSNYIS